MRTANDVLPALFLSDDPAEVIAAAAALPGLSSGRVTHPETFNRRTGKPERGGLFCSKVFGPVEDDRCICGKYSGPAHAGQTCEKCGVLCGPSRLRGERWGHVESALPLVHPRLVPSIARAIGCSARDVQAVVLVEKCLHPDGRVTAHHVDDREGHGAVDLEPHLGEHRELLMRRVPVIPPAWRGTRRDPQDEAYRALVSRCNRTARLLELNAPQIILDNELRMSQEAFERVLQAVRVELAARRPIVVAPVTARAEALLQAVYDDPASDAARLAYADHLRAAGDLRGEFIARQLASAARGRGRRGARLPRDEDDLLRRNFERWVAPLAGLVDERVLFRRGFPAACRTLPAAAARVDDPAWSTIEHLESDLPDLIVHPGLRALGRLTCPWRTLRAVCERDVPLPQVHTLTVRLPRQPDEPERFTAAAAFPGLRDLTFIQGSGRGGEWGWLAGTPIARGLRRLQLLLRPDRLPALDLPYWTRFVLHHPALEAVTLALDRRDLVFEIRRDNHWCTLHVGTSSRFIEHMALGLGGLAEDLVAALTALAPEDVFKVDITSRHRWFGEDADALARRLREHFGGALTLPPIA